ncbi:uncharacterized protein [Argopecten irradians]|uniref:uncharacterized protein n=1 Tax=Argopecten irradians TaxID=31199 RepID=UPI00371619C3
MPDSKATSKEKHQVGKMVEMADFVSNKAEIGVEENVKWTGTLTKHCSRLRKKDRQITITETRVIYINGSGQDKVIQYKRTEFDFAKRLIKVFSTKRNYELTAKNEEDFKCAAKELGYIGPDCTISAPHNTKHVFSIRMGHDGQKLETPDRDPSTTSESEVIRELEERGREKMSNDLDITDRCEKNGVTSYKSLYGQSEFFPISHQQMKENVRVDFGDDVSINSLHIYGDVENEHSQNTREFNTKAKYFGEGASIVTMNDTVHMLPVDTVNKSEDLTTHANPVSMCSKFPPSVDGFDENEDGSLNSSPVMDTKYLHPMNAFAENDDGRSHPYPVGDIKLSPSVDAATQKEDCSFHDNHVMDIKYLLQVDASTENKDVRSHACPIKNTLSQTSMNTFDNGFDGSEDGSLNAHSVMDTKLPTTVEGFDGNEDGSLNASVVIDTKYQRSGNASKENQDRRSHALPVRSNLSQSSMNTFENGFYGSEDGGLNAHPVMDTKLPPTAEGCDGNEEDSLNASGVIDTKNQRSGNASTENKHRRSHALPARSTLLQSSINTFGRENGSTYQPSVDWFDESEDGSLNAHSVMDTKLPPSLDTSTQIENDGLNASVVMDTKSPPTVDGFDGNEDGRSNASVVMDTNYLRLVNAFDENEDGHSHPNPFRDIKLQPSVNASTENGECSIHSYPIIGTKYQRPVDASTENKDVRSHDLPNRNILSQSSRNTFERKNVTTYQPSVDRFDESEDGSLNAHSVRYEKLSPSLDTSTQNGNNDLNAAGFMGTKYLRPLNRFDENENSRSHALPDRNTLSQSSMKTFERNKDTTYPTSVYGFDGNDDGRLNTSVVMENKYLYPMNGLDENEDGHSNPNPVRDTNLPPTVDASNSNEDCSFHENLVLDTKYRRPLNISTGNQDRRSHANPVRRTLSQSSVDESVENDDDRSHVFLPSVDKCKETGCSSSYATTDILDASNIVDNKSCMPPGYVRNQISNVPGKDIRLLGLGGTQTETDDTPDSDEHVFNSSIKQNATLSRLEDKEKSSNRLQEERSSWCKWQDRSDLQPTLSSCKGRHAIDTWPNAQQKTAKNISGPQNTLYLKEEDGEKNNIRLKKKAPSISSGQDMKDKKTGLIELQKAEFFREKYHIDQSTICSEISPLITSGKTTETQVRIGRTHQEREGENDSVPAQYTLHSRNDKELEHNCNDPSTNTGNLKASKSELNTQIRPSYGRSLSTTPFKDRDNTKKHRNVVINKCNEKLQFLKQQSMFRLFPKDTSSMMDFSSSAFLSPNAIHQMQHITVAPVHSVEPNGASVSQEETDPNHNQNRSPFSFDLRNYPDPAIRIGHTIGECLHHEGCFIKLYIFTAG